MEQLTSFISSRGLLKSCHSRNRHPVSSSADIDTELIDRHAHGRTIYVCTDALRNFAVNFLPKITLPFVLVTGDSDAPVSQELLNTPEISAILHSGLLTSWFAQNLRASHPKLSSLPIGLDYHTMWERPGAWGISAISATAQEHTLMDTLASAPPLNDRYMNAYCNWRPVPGWGDREECFSKIDRTVCLFENGAISRASSWKRQSEFRYVVSPEGIGMDCHRTWEAILLGCTPIVKRNPMSGIFEKLPIMIVEDWSEINADNLRRFSLQITDRKFDFSILFREYWIQRMAATVQDFLMPMTYQEFIKYMVRKTG